MRRSARRKSPWGGSGHSRCGGRSGSSDGASGSRDGGRSTGNSRGGSSGGGGGSARGARHGGRGCYQEEHDQYMKLWSRYAPRYPVASSGTGRQEAQRRGRNSPMEVAELAGAELIDMAELAPEEADPAPEEATETVAKGQRSTLFEVRPWPVRDSRRVRRGVPSSKGKSKALTSSGKGLGDGGRVDGDTSGSASSAGGLLSSSEGRGVGLGKGGEKHAGRRRRSARTLGGRFCSVTHAAGAKATDGSKLELGVLYRRVERTSAKRAPKWVGIQSGKETHCRGRRGRRSRRWIPRTGGIE